MAKSTGWSRDAILWELPLREAFAIEHCHMLHSGASTRAANSKQDDLADHFAILALKG